MHPTSIDIVNEKTAITEPVARFDDAVNRRDVLEFERL
jgi:hypothetical protein